MPLILYLLSIAPLFLETPKKERETDNLTCFFLHWRLSAAQLHITL